jgi:hypothetical protein
MNRIATRVLAGTAAAAMISALGISAASAVTATITVKVGSKPVVNAAGTVLVDGTITATANVAGSVAFLSSGTAIKGCEAVTTTASGTSFVALCAPWQPAAAGKVDLTAVLTPADAAIAKVTSPVVAWVIGTPINTLGDEPISIYMDTVNGTGPGAYISTATSGPAYNAATGCVILNQFVQGQMIVFRLYANDFSRGGAPLTGKDAAISLKIAGWDTPVALSYGDHAGTAFWAAGFKTGPGFYNTLGTIGFKVNITLIEKPAVTKEVMVTKYVKMLNKKTKKPLKVNGAYVWKPVKTKGTEIVMPAVLGRTVSFDSTTWGPTTSNLTLNAAPAAK